MLKSCHFSKINQHLSPFYIENTMRVDDKMTSQPFSPMYFLTSKLFSPVNFSYQWTVNFSPQSNFTPQLVSPVSQRVALEVLTKFSFWNRIFSLSSNHGYKYNFARIQRSHLFNWLVNCNAMHSLELSQFRVKRVYLEMLLWQKDLKDYNYNHAIWFYK